MAPVKNRLLVLSAVATLLLVLAQVGSFLEYILVPAPTAATTGPQSGTDLALGLLAAVGGGLGLLLAIVSGIVGLAVAAAERDRLWTVFIGLSMGMAVLGLMVTAFLLLGAPRNPYHPLVVGLLVSLAAAGYGLSRRPTTP